MRVTGGWVHLDEVLSAAHGASRSAHAQRPHPQRAQAQENVVHCHVGVSGDQNELLLRALLILRLPLFPGLPPARHIATAADTTTSPTEAKCNPQRTQELGSVEDVITITSTLTTQTENLVRQRCTGQKLLSQERHYQQPPRQFKEQANTILTIEQTITLAATPFALRQPQACHASNPSP